MKWWPSKPMSTVRRLMILVVGVSMFSLVIHTVFLILVLPTMGKQLARSTVDTVHVSRQLLLTGRDPASLQRLKAIGIDAKPIQTIQKPWDLADSPAQMRFLIQEIRLLLADGIEIQNADATGIIHRKALEFQFLIEQQPWSITVLAPTPPPGGAFFPALVLFVTIGGAALAAMLFGVRQITTPISQVSQQMLARRHSLSKIDAAPHLGTELLDIVHAFNAIVDALQDEKATRRNMLAGLSHDLRTPLARLQLRAELECPEATNLGMQGDFAALSRMIDHFLSYVQGDAAELATGHPRSVSGIAHEVIESFRATGARVALTRGNYLGHELPDLAIQRILSNLIDNALAHGQAPIHVEVDTSGGDVRLSVFDHGRGIAAIDLTTALRPFGKLASSSTKLGHSGLGLAIVSQIAAQIGGRVILHQWDGLRSGVGVVIEATEPAAANPV